MTKEELTHVVAEILAQIHGSEPPVKGGAYKTLVLEAGEGEKTPVGEAAADVTAVDLRSLYLTENPADAYGFRRLKEKTPARLGSGRAGPRYKTLTMLRFRADHAAAQDAVFSEVAADFPRTHDLLPVKTRCSNKEEYLTRPDLGRCFDEENTALIRSAVSDAPVVQLVVGDGLSAAAVAANAPECLAAIREGLKQQGIETGKAIFVKYCRVGAGDAIGDITGCRLVCVLVGERPGLVTDQSMSVYLTYGPHKGVSESARTVVSNIHPQGTPAREAGAQTAALIGKILRRQVSGVGLHLEETP